MLANSSSSKADSDKRRRVGCDEDIEALVNKSDRRAGAVRMRGNKDWWPYGNKHGDGRASTPEQDASRVGARGPGGAATQRYTASHNACRRFQILVMVPTLLNLPDVPHHISRKLCLGLGSLGSLTMTKYSCSCW